MAYVRKKKARGKTVYQLVEGYRAKPDGKVKQRVLAHLGECETVEQALRWWPRRIVKLRLVAHEAREKVAFVPKSFRKWRAKDYWGSRFLDEHGNMVRLKASPHDYAGHAKTSVMDVRDSTDAFVYAYFSNWDLHKHYWDHVDQAEQLEREADNLEERLLKLSVVLDGTSESIKKQLTSTLSRIIAAKRQVEERREAAILRAWGVA